MFNFISASREKKYIQHSHTCRDFLYETDIDDKNKVPNETFAILLRRNF